MGFSLTATAVIAAPPARVFDTITDIGRLPDWNLEIPKVVDVPRSLEVGAEWVVEMRALHTHWTSRSTVLEIDAERGRFAYRSRSDDGNPSYAEWTWDVTADPAGAHVRVSVGAHPRTFWRRALLARIRPTGLRKAMDESLRALGRLVTADDRSSRARRTG